MKKNITFLSLSLLILLNSCSIEKHVIDNNILTKKQIEKTDSIFIAIDTISKKFNNHILTLNPPDIDELKIVPLDVFYFGEIVQEEIVERKNGWLKIKLTEKIKLQNNQTILKDKYGWFSYQSHDKVYLTDDNNQPVGLKSPFATSDIDLKSYTITPLLISTKNDLLDQKTLDMLLSQRALNFDGLKFDNKRFDFSNFSLGSFRGTYFLNSNLSNIIATREFLTNDNDFFRTRIDGGINKDMLFKYWKFTDVIFFNTTIENSTFENSIFSSSITGLVSFNNTNFLNSKFSNSKDGYFSNIVHNNSTYQNCRFDDVKIYNGINFNTRIENSNFFNCLWQNTSYSLNSRIVGGYYLKLKVIGGDYSRIKIESFGGTKSNFENCEFINAVFTNSTIDAWFSQNTSFSGLNDFSNNNFTSSIFESVTFGNAKQSSLFRMRNSNFSNVEFRNQVKFIKCDLTGSTWPSDMSNVQFIDCIGKN